MSRAHFTRRALPLMVALVPLGLLAIAPSREQVDSRSGAKSASGQPIPAERLGNSDYCGHCHTDIFHQWNASTHHFSSFNNPVYRRVALDTAERKGPQAIEFCASCHDPLPLIAGENPTVALDSWSTNAGITCLACHRITAIHGGNGSYEITAPTLHPFALSELPLQRKLHHLLLQWTPGLHRQVLSKPFYKSPEYCATCHTVTSPAHINGANDLLMQDEYGQWHASRYSADAQHGDEHKSCIDCHMPLVPSRDPAAKDGLIRSHRFVGGNTLLPGLNLDFDQLHATERFLRDGVVSLSCRASFNEREANTAPCDRLQPPPGSEIELTIEIANIGAGHNFPAGTSDSNEAWVSIRVTDASGNVLLKSGDLDGQGQVDPSSYFLRTLYADRNGVPVDRRNATTDAAMKVSDTTIAADASAPVRYLIKLPPSAILPLQIEARLNWRKYSQPFVDWVFEGKRIAPPPVTVMAETKAVMGQPPR
jgi:hypothetical protein